MNPGSTRAIDSAIRANAAGLGALFPGRRAPFRRLFQLEGLVEKLGEMTENGGFAHHKPGSRGHGFFAEIRGLLAAETNHREMGG